MREKMRKLKAGWTSPNAFPWDELTEIICGLDDQLTAMYARIEALELATKVSPSVLPDARVKGKTLAAGGQQHKG